MNPTVYQTSNGAQNPAPSFNIPQPVAAAPASAPVHNTPIAGFLFSVSRTANGEYWPIYEGPNQIGRGPQSIVKLEDNQVSERHATLVIRPMMEAGVKTGVLVYIEDNASICGTMLNGTSLGFEPKECKMGDIITIGPNYELYLMLVNATALGLEPKAALQNQAPAPAAAPAPAPAAAPSWGPGAMPGMSSNNGPKGTMFQGAGVSANPMAGNTPSNGTMYMPKQ